MVQISSDWANLKYALYGITLFAAVTIIVEQVLGGPLHHVINVMTYEHY